MRFVIERNKLCQTCINNEESSPNLNDYKPWLIYKVFYNLIKNNKIKYFSMKKNLQ